MKKLMSIFGATLFVSALMFTSCTSEEATVPEEKVVEEVIEEVIEEVNTGDPTTPDEVTE